MSPFNEAYAITMATGVDVTDENAVKNFAKAMSELYLKDTGKPKGKPVLETVTAFQEAANKEDREELLDEVYDLTYAHVGVLAKIGNLDDRQMGIVSYTMHHLSQDILGVLDGNGTEDYPGYTVVRNKDSQEPPADNLSGHLADQYYRLIQS